MPGFFPGRAQTAGGFPGGLKKVWVLAGLMLGMTVAASADPFLAGADFSLLSFF